jgi:hypothetical protein
MCARVVTSLLKQSLVIAAVCAACTWRRWRSHKNSVRICWLLYSETAVFRIAVERISNAVLGCGSSLRGNWQGREMRGAQSRCCCIFAFAGMLTPNNLSKRRRSPIDTALHFRRHTFWRCVVSRLPPRSKWGLRYCGMVVPKRQWLPVNAA